MKRQDGFALPGVMFLLIGMMAILAVGAVAAATTQRGAARDGDSKSALAVAEIGVDTALLRYVRAGEAGVIDEATPCVDGDGTAGTAGTDGWCAVVHDPAAEGEYQYYVRPEVQEIEDEDGEVALDVAVEVVSVGTASGAARVIEVYADKVAAIDPEPIYLTETLVADEHIELDPGVDIYGSIGSNGTIGVGSSTQVCGEIRYGDETGTEIADLTAAQDACADYTGDPPYQESLPLDEVTLPEGVDWEQNNTHLGSLPGVSSWDATSRTLRIDGSSTVVTVDQPGPYLLCRLEVDNQATLKMAPGVEASFYFDEPENCHPQDDELADIDVNGETVTDAYVQMSFTRGNVTVEDEEPFPVFYFLGSDEEETAIDVNTNSGKEGEFRGVIFAPRTHIVNSMGGLRLTGALVGKTVSMHSGGDVTDYEVVIEGGEFQIGVNESIYSIFDKQSFRECPVSAADAAAPYESC